RHVLRAGLVRCDVFVARWPINRHLVAITAGDDSNELLGHIPIAVNEPAAFPALPHSFDVYAIASNGRRARDIDAERAKRSLCLHERAAAISAPGFERVAKQSRCGVNVQAT